MAIRHGKELRANANGGVSQTAVDNSIAAHNIDLLSHENIREEISGIDSRVEALSNLGHYVGTFDNYATPQAAGNTTVPLNISGLAVTPTINDFAEVRSDETNGGYPTRYVILNIAGNGDIAWDHNFTFSNDIGGKADKVAGATAGNLAGLDANGNLIDSGIKNPMLLGVPGSYRQGVDFENLQTFLDENINNRLFSALVTIHLDRDNEENIFFYNIATISKSISAQNTTTQNTLILHSHGFKLGSIVSWRNIQGQASIYGLICDYLYATDAPCYIYSSGADGPSSITNRLQVASSNVGIISEGTLTTMCQKLADFCYGLELIVI
jgi:hypothetical protein